MKDSIIIGSGPAGISAAIYLNNLNKDVLVLGKDFGQLTKNDIVDNYYGFLPIPGNDLIKKGIEQALHLGIDVVMESVVDIIQENTHFKVITPQNTYLGKTVVLATGKPRLPLKVPGFSRFKGKGIHMCATCDGYFYKRKKIALIGHGPYMEQELQVLENYTSDIVIFSQGHSYSNANYDVITDPIKSFSGDDNVKLIHTEKQSIEISGVFVAVGFPTANELALKLGLVQEKSNILVDAHYMSNIPGIFAGGDCIGGKLQISKAVYDGLMLSDAINQYLKSL